MLPYQSLVFPCQGAALCPQQPTQGARGRLSADRSRSSGPVSECSMQDRLGPSRRCDTMQRAHCRVEDDTMWRDVVRCWGPRRRSACSVSARAGRAFEARESALPVRRPRIWDSGGRRSDARLAHLLRVVDCATSDLDVVARALSTEHGLSRDSTSWLPAGNGSCCSRSSVPAGTPQRPCRAPSSHLQPLCNPTHTTFQQATP